MMKLLEVNDSGSERLFLQVPKLLYKNDPHWVCPLDNMIKNCFKPEKNGYLRNGEAGRWIILDDNGKPIGRIAAFYNQKKSFVDKSQPCGGIGFFECIDDSTAAKLLFDTAKEWLSSKGMAAMDGPVNIGENFMNWGLLVKGYVQPGFGMNYNFPYYKRLFEEYGFQLYFRQYSFHLDVKKPFPERFWKIAEWVAQKPNFTFEHFSFKNQDKYLKDLCEIYNATWSEFKTDFTPITFDDVKEGFEPARAIIDEKLVWFAYHHGQPIAFFIMYPDVNQIFKRFVGKMNIINMLRFVIARKRGEITRIRSLIAGVVPKFHNSGIESAILSKYRDVVLKKKSYRHYREVELSWVGDFNPRMQAIYIKTGAEWAKTHYTYRYLFDSERKFERFMPESVHLLGEERD